MAAQHDNYRRFLVTIDKMLRGWLEIGFQSNPGRHSERVEKAYLGDDGK